MKKFILSFVVILLLSFYVVYSRIDLSLKEPNQQEQVADQSTTTVISLVKISTPTSTLQSDKENQTSALYKDGQYIGTKFNVFYGEVQVAAVIKKGKLVDVKVLEKPHERSTSVEINKMALPLLKTEAIAAQSAKIDIVSGATQTSGGYIKSLASALAQAKYKNGMDCCVNHQ